MRTVIPAQDSLQDRDSSSLARSNALAFGKANREHPLLRLQRSIGNQATLRMLQTRAIQTKLTVNEPGDQYEQEADRVADQVMRMSAPLHEPSKALAAPASFSESVQASPANSSHEEQTTAPPIVEDVLRSQGQPLDLQTRTFMEPRFGQDFSHVRVHTGTAAEQSAQDVNAHAYTVGSDIVFGSGQYRPGTTAGDRLLAHEMTHVIQQGHAGGAIQRAPVADAAPTTAQKDPAKSLVSQEERDANAKDVAIANSLTPEDRQLRENSLNIVAADFLWIADNTGPMIDKLKNDLEEENTPSWSEKLLGAVLDVALLAGAAGFAELMVSKYVEELLVKAVEKKGITENMKEGGHEFIKSFVEQGTGKGIQTGRDALQGGSDKNVIEKFILSQRLGVIDMYKENHDHFIHIGRSLIKTAEEAKALEIAMQETYQKAPQIQYERVRDAWVAYLAQQKFGTTSTRAASGQETVTTDMSNQERRDRTTHFDYGHGYDMKDYGGEDQNPDQAPDLQNAILRKSHDAGVLYVSAQLPEIKEMPWRPDVKYMAGKPTVKLAVLNGVNDKIRDQYKGKALSELHIPRQIVAKVEGDTPDFILNLDENGEFYAYKQKVDWLRDRAMVTNPAAISKPTWPENDGIKLLLQELVVDEIKEGM